MEDWHFLFGLLITILSISGVAINFSALVLLTRKRPLSIFHQLIRILSVYDLLVVICGALSYGLPNVWPLYNDSVLPKISPFLTPVVHMALMVSVYCTVLISFERYIRICYLCQLRDSRLVTDSNILYYKLAILIFPVLFYLPKFFEVRYEQMTLNYNVTFDCSKVIMKAIANTKDMADFASWSNTTTLGSCLQMSTTLGVLNVTLVVQKSRKFLEPVPTSLRQSPLYYKLYCVLLNTLVAALLPLAALFYLNVSTVKALRKMQLESESSPIATAEVSTAVVQPENHDNVLTVVISSPDCKNKSNARCFVFRKSVRSAGRSYPKFFRWGRRKQEKKLLNANDNNVLTAECQSDCQGQKQTSTNSVILNFGVHEDVLLKVAAGDKLKNPPTSFSCNFHDEGGRANSFDEDLGRQMSKSWDALPTTESVVVSTAADQDVILDPAEEGTQIGNVDGKEVGRKMKREAAKKLPKLDLAGVAPSASTRRRQHQQHHHHGGNSSTSSSCSHVQERRLARISISIVWLFTFCHAWKAVPTIYESWHSEDGLHVKSWPFWLVIVEHISHSLIMFNSAVNFLIYVLS